MCAFERGNIERAPARGNDKSRMKASTQCQVGELNELIVSTIILERIYTSLTTVPQLAGCRRYHAVVPQSFRLRCQFRPKWRQIGGRKYS